MSSNYALHPEAFRDINDIWEYIAKENPDAADRVAGDMFSAFDRLAISPQAGHRRSDLTTHPLRFWRVHNYLIAYAPEEHPIWIIAVLHGRRSPYGMAAILRGRE